MRESPTLKRAMLWDLVCSFYVMVDKTVFCNIFCMAGKSGWDMEGRVV